MQKIGNSDSPTNNQVMPHFTVTNNNSNSLNLNDIVIEYFIYEPQLNLSTLSWRNDWCRIGNNNNASSAYSISFSRLDTAFTDGDKKADIKITISFEEGYNLEPEEIAEIQFTFYRNDWQYNFNEETHWSWINSSTYSDADSTVVRSVDISNCQTGTCVLVGSMPPNSTIILDAYPENCGTGENMMFDKNITSGRFNSSANGQKLTLNKTSIEFQNNSGFTSSGNFGMLQKSILNNEELSFSYSKYPLVSLTTVDAFGISTKSIETEALKVDGIIKARNITVTAKNWPDYVFESDYKLTSLKNVESFINKNGHLPGIPSAKEVSKNGVDVVELQSKLLKKIEELTLHVLSMNKDNGILKNRIEMLEVVNQKLLENNTGE